MRRGPLLLAAALLPTVALAGLDPDTVRRKSLDECDMLVRDHPRDSVAYLCYYLNFVEGGNGAAAVERVESHLADGPNPHAELYLGRILAELGRGERAEGLFRSAVEGFIAEADVRGEIWARESLAINLDYRGRSEEALREFRSVLDVAVDHGDPELEAEVLISFAWSKARHSEHGAAWSLYHRAAAVILPDGPKYLKIRVLNGLASNGWYLGMYQESLDQYREILKLIGSGYAKRAASVRADMALVARGLVHEGRMSEEELVRLKREALEAALVAEDLDAEIKARLLLAESLRTAEAAEQAREAMRIATENGLDALRDWAQWVLADYIVLEDPSRIEEARLLVDETEERAIRRGDLESLARIGLVRSTMYFTAGDRDAAIAAGLRALDAIERMRDCQPDAGAQARVFGRFAYAYRRLASYLLDAERGEPTPEELDAAFGILERLRSRRLLDRLDIMHLTDDLASEEPLVLERRELLDKIAAAYRRLVAPDLPSKDRDGVLADLVRLEADERGLREAIAAQNPRFASIRVPSIPDIATVRSRLDDDQAIVSFHLATQAHGGSWAMVLTAEAARAIRLDAGASLDAEVRTYVALLGRRDGSSDAAGVRLHQLLLGDVLGSLPEKIARLLIVPDGALHWLPFGSLRASSDDPPLAASYELSVIPSHTIWLRWKRTPAAQAPESLLAVADPQLSFAELQATIRSGELDAGDLGRLPYARREAEEMRRGLGGRGLVLAGRRASERDLKELDLSEFRVIHFATHAVVDEHRPERSAILLAASDDEDGLLRFREVTELPLDGQLILLSACSSGAGPVIGGDGVMGLANAFFLAGGRTVVAALWPLRDDEAARLVEVLGRALGRGRTVAASLAEAQRELIRHGAPTAAWAGLVVLGDGELVVAAEPVRRTPSVLLASAVLLAIVLLALFARRGHHG